MHALSVIEQHFHKPSTPVFKNPTGGKVPLLNTIWHDDYEKCRKLTSYWYVITGFWKVLLGCLIIALAFRKWTSAMKEVAEAIDVKGRSNTQQGMQPSDIK